MIQSIHVTSIKFSEVAASVVGALTEFLGDSNNPSAQDVVSFVREVVEKFPALRPAICEQLMSTLSSIKSGRVFRGVLWILGEYVEEVEDVQKAMQEIRRVIGEIPILAEEQRLLDEQDAPEQKEENGTAEPAAGSKPKVLADGTYATENAFTSSTSAKLDAVKAAKKPPLRCETRLLIFFSIALTLFQPLSSAAISSLVRFWLRHSQSWS